jgi:hypothetical protein
MENFHLNFFSQFDKILVKHCFLVHPKKNKFCFEIVAKIYFFLVELAALQKRLLLYKKQKIMLNFVICTGFIQITTNKFCLARMCSCMCGVFILKKNLHKQKLEKLLQKFVEISFLLYKIALKLKLL